MFRKNGLLESRNVLTLTVFLLLLFTVFGLFPAHLWGKSASSDRARALNFSLNDLSGGDLSFKNLRGKTVVLNFWATWCPPCVAEMPALNRLSMAYKEKGVVVVGINIGEPREKVKAFIGKLGISFTILLDKEGRVEERYHIAGVPTTFFIDKRGYIQDVAVGGTSYSVFENKLKGVL